MILGYVIALYSEGQRWLHATVGFVCESDLQNYTEVFANDIIIYPSKMSASDNYHDILPNLTDADQLFVESISIV
jgi:hypothetical protein